MTDLKTSLMQITRLPDVPSPTGFDPETGKLTGPNVFDPTAQYLAIRDSDGAAVLHPERLEAEERARSLSALERFGAALPPRIAELRNLSAAIDQARYIPDPLSISDLTADNAADKIREFATAKALASAAQEEQRNLGGQIRREMTNQFRQSIGHFLGEKPIRAAFDDAAKRFAQAYPVVRECRSLTDAAAMDATGAGVVAWHAATRAAADLDAVVGLLVGIIAPAWQGVREVSPRLRTEPARILGLSADPTDDGVAYLSALRAHSIESHDRLQIMVNGRYSLATATPDALPFGVFGAQVDAQCVLSLPADAAQLRDRAERFNPGAVRDAAILDAVGGR
ncbi:hypothetical protein ACL02T_08525 [Pseudonocardia sp. RS010]|uniref:hypothetical protein n=1 Tax=Pseudonocardia sp. RS010 TaxID=3385979 RepID=UPI0039A3538D